MLNCTIVEIGCPIWQLPFCQCQLVLDRCETFYTALAVLFIPWSGCGTFDYIMCSTMLYVQQLDLRKFYSHSWDMPLCHLHNFQRSWNAGNGRLALTRPVNCPLFMHNFMWPIKCARALSFLTLARKVLEYEVAFSLHRYAQCPEFVGTTHLRITIVPYTKSNPDERESSRLSSDLNYVIESSPDHRTHR